MRRWTGRPLDHAPVQVREMGERVEGANLACTQPETPGVGGRDAGQQGASVQPLSCLVVYLFLLRRYDFRFDPFFGFFETQLPG